MINDTNTLIFNVTEHRNDFSGCDYNAFAAALEDEGADVAGAETPSGIEMRISNMAPNEIQDIAENCGIMDCLEYIVSDDASVVDESEEIEECNKEIEECNEDAPYFTEFNEDEDLDMFDDLSDVDDFVEDEEFDIETGRSYPSYEDIAGELEIEDDYIEDEYADGSDLGYEAELIDDGYADEIDEAFKYRSFKKHSPKRSRKLNEEIDMGGVKYDDEAIVSDFIRNYIADLGISKVKNVYRYVCDLSKTKDPDDILLKFTQELLSDYCEDRGISKIANGVIYKHEYQLTDAVAAEYPELFDGVNEKRKGCCPKRSRKLNEENETTIPEIEAILTSMFKSGSANVAIKITSAAQNNSFIKILKQLCTNVVSIPAEVLDAENFGETIFHAVNLDDSHDNNINILQDGEYRAPFENVLIIENIENLRLKTYNPLAYLVDKREYIVRMGLRESRRRMSNVNIICTFNEEPDYLHNPSCADRFHYYELLTESRNSRKHNLISLTEALKSFDEKDQKKLDKVKMSVEDILKMVKGQTIGEQEARDAFAKLKKEQNAIKKIKKNDKEMYSLKDVPGVIKAVKSMLKVDPENKEMKKFYDQLTESVVTALAQNKKSLYENAILRGKKLGETSYKELCAIYESIVENKKALTSKLKESDVTSAEGKAIKESIAKKVKTLSILNEELSYRKVAANVFKKLNEEEETEEKKDDEPSMDDLAAMFGSGDMGADDSKKDSDGADDKEDSKSEEDEETEEVELARIVIEMASKEDAEQLMTLCKDAGIPEDAMEIETGEEDDEDDESDEASEENDTESEDEEADDEAKNESIRYSNIRRLFEADGEDEEAEETESDEASEEGDTDAEGDEGDDEGKESEEGSVKFVLTNSDYVNELAGVLADEYGISEEEFEGMIGGEIVESDDEETESEEDEDKKDDADESEEDDIDASDIFGNM